MAFSTLKLRDASSEVLPLESFRMASAQAGLRLGREQPETPQHHPPLQKSPQPHAVDPQERKVKQSKSEKVKKKIECFEDLFIWQKAVEFAKDIFVVTEKPGLKADFGLKSQLRNAVVSISANIAEGFERRSRKEYLNFLNIAKGSAGEVRSLLSVAHQVGYLSDKEIVELVSKSRFLSGSIANHAKAIIGSGS